MDVVRAETAALASSWREIWDVSVGRLALSAIVGRDARLVLKMEELMSFWIGSECVRDVGAFRVRMPHLGTLVVRVGSEVGQSEMEDVGDGGVPRYSMASLPSGVGGVPRLLFSDALVMSSILRVDL